VLVKSKQLNSAATLLIVDDLPENLAVLSELLEPHYRVLTATTGERALQLATRYPKPDLILLDVTMPGLDGYAVLARLCQDTVTSDIPVIFVTARDSDTGLTSTAPRPMLLSLLRHLLRKRIAPGNLMIISRASLYAPRHYTTLVKSAYPTTFCLSPVN